MRGGVPAENKSKILQKQQKRKETMKTINRKMLMSAVAAVAVSAASAAALKWTVNVNEGVSWDKLTFSAFGTDGNQISGTSADGTKGYIASGEAFFKYDATTGKAEVKPYSGTQKDTWVEVGALRFVLNNGDTTVGSTTWGTPKWDDVWAKLKAGQSFTADLKKDNATIGTITLMPEPTSGLMLLLGAGMLALRRKRCVA
ncbi:MAG TPA: hypothetical protein DER26_04705 [Verrucomicrobia bacterium]|nr:hypothetical protein [Verrucomicrobiota bacterium]